MLTTLREMKRATCLRSAMSRMMPAEKKRMPMSHAGSMEPTTSFIMMNVDPQMAVTMMRRTLYVDVGMASKSMRATVASFACLRSDLHSCKGCQCRGGCMRAVVHGWRERVLRLRRQNVTSW